MGRNKKKEGQRKEGMFKQKCRAISLDIRLQNLNTPMFKISSRNCAFSQWHHMRI